MSVTSKENTDTQNYSGFAVTSGSPSMPKNPDKQYCEFLRPAAMLLQSAPVRDEMAHFTVASWYLHEMVTQK